MGRDRRAAPHEDRSRHRPSAEGDLAHPGQLDRESGRRRRGPIPDGERRLYRIEPGVNRLYGGEVRPDCDSRLAVGVRAAWLLDTCTGNVIRIDHANVRPSGSTVATGKRSTTVMTASGITASADALWVGRHDSAVRIDPLAGRVVATVSVPTTLIAVGRRGVWLLDPLGWIRRVDPATNRVVGRPVCVPAADSHC